MTQAEKPRLIQFKNCGNLISALDENEIDEEGASHIAEVLHEQG